MTNHHASGFLKGLSATLLAAALGTPVPAHAITFSGQAGGIGGSAFTLNCPAGRVLNGLMGRAGDFIDKVQGVCTRIDEIGDVVATTATSTQGGGGGNGDFDLRCPRGQAVVGLQGRADWYVDRVQLVCARLEADGTALPSSETVDPFDAGGSGGKSFTLHCPGATPAHGLRGSASLFVDRIGLTCDNAQYATLSQGRPTRTGLRPDLRVVISDVPYRVHEGDEVEFTAVLWNVGSRTAPEGTEMDIGTAYPVSFPFIDAGFLGNAGCDVHNPPVNEIVRCETAGPTAPLDARMAVTVTFTANGGTGNFQLRAIGDPRGLVAESNEQNNQANLVLRVVD